MHFAPSPTVHEVLFEVPPALLAMLATVHLFHVIVLVLGIAVGGGEVTSLVSINNQYLRYLEEFGKDPARAKDARRVERFAKNLELLNKHKQTVGLKASYSLRLNHFSDHLPEEISEMFTESPAVEEPQVMPTVTRSSRWYIADWISTTADVVFPFRLPWWELIPVPDLDKSSAAVDGSLPASLDWSSNNNPLETSVMPAVRNQVWLPPRSLYRQFL